MSEGTSHEAQGGDTGGARLRSHWYVLAVAVLIYVAFYLVFYPPIHGIEDEAGFINQALIWAKGSLTVEGAGYGEMYDSIVVNNRHVFYRNPGRPLIILPFVLAGGLRAVFVSGALIHIAITVVGALVLARLGKSPLYACLLLCHPTLAIYSRTIMGDAPAALSLLLALFALTRAQRPGLWVGGALGIGAIMRLHSIVVLPFVLAAMFVTLPRREWVREVVLCCAATTAGVVSLVSYNAAMFGSPLPPFAPLFDAGFLFHNVGFYLIALALLWPLMIVTPVVDRSVNRLYFMALSLPLLGLLCLYYWYDKGASYSETVVLGQRLLQPALPAWIVAYSVTADDWIVSRLQSHLPERLVTCTVVFAGIVLLSGVGLAFRAHQLHLLRFVSARDEVISIIPKGSLVVGNGTLRKVFGVTYDGVPEYRWKMYEFEGVVLDHTAVIAAESQAWFIAYLEKSGTADDMHSIDEEVEKFGMTRLPTSSPGLVIYRAMGAKRSVVSRSSGSRQLANSSNSKSWLFPSGASTQPRTHMSLATGGSG